MVAILPSEGHLCAWIHRVAVVSGSSHAIPKPRDKVSYKSKNIYSSNTELILLSR